MGRLDAKAFSFAVPLCGPCVLVVKGNSCNSE
jgi:hypothetical protein